MGQPVDRSGKGISAYDLGANLNWMSSKTKYAQNFLFLQVPFLSENRIIRFLGYFVGVEKTPAQVPLYSRMGSSSQNPEGFARKKWLDSKSSRQKTRKTSVPSGKNRTRRAKVRCLPVHRLCADSGSRSCCRLEANIEGYSKNLATQIQLSSPPSSFYSEGLYRWLKSSPVYFNLSIWD